MKKKLLTLAAIIGAYPQMALAHFTTPHEPFWHEPMHFFLRHYYGLGLIAVGLVFIIVALKKKSENE